jgi:hypothetical protein
MKTNLKKIALNRAVFAARAFESRALTVLTTLFHRFEQGGDYEIFIRLDDQLARRMHLRVTPENAPYQFNVDMASRGEGDDGLTLRVGGVIGFFASSGAGRYTVEVRHITGEEKRTVLDSAAGIPAGDLFSVTLVNPGTYKLVELASQAQLTVRVGMPPAPVRTREERTAGAELGLARRAPARFRTDQSGMVTFDKGKFEMMEVTLMAGQTLVIHCVAQAQLRVEPVGEPPSPEPPTPPGGTRPPVGERPPLAERPRFTFRKRPTEIK